MSTHIAEILNSRPPSGEVLSRANKYLGTTAPKAVLILDEHEELHHEERANSASRHLRVMELQEALAAVQREARQNEDRLNPDEPFANGWPSKKLRLS
jgi:hypothetical protein